MTHSIDLPAIELAGGMRLAHWCKIIGISKRTALRWHQAGKLGVVHRNGHTFVTAETIREFWQGQEVRPPLRGATAREVPPPPAGPASPGRL